jgi:hypothetical protein
VARIRTIKPEFFTSEDIVARSPMARLLYIALWCEADKEGRFVWKPATFKLRYLPGDDCNVQALCSELVDAGLVVLYGDGYAYIPAFKAHQHINPRESDSQLPEPDAKTTRQPRVGTRQSRDNDATVTRREEGKGREGKEKPASAERKTGLPPGFAVSARVKAWALEKGHRNLDANLEALVSYAKRKGAKYADWDEALMMAIRDNWAKVELAQDPFAGAI